MTKSDLLDIANTYKIELNKTNVKMANCKQSINIFKQLSNFYQQRCIDVKKTRNILVFLYIASLLATGIIAFFSFGIAALVGLMNIIFGERFLFFNSVAKKFDMCHSMFAKTSNNLSHQQAEFELKKKDMLDLIIKLEKLSDETLNEQIEFLKKEYNLFDSSELEKVDNNISL